MILVGCAGGAEGPFVLPEPEHLQIAPLAAADIEPAPLITTSFAQREDNSIAVAHGANDFAFALSATLLEDVGTDNFVVSPYSVWLPLAALINATREDYRPTLIEVLAQEGIDVAYVNRAASRMLFDLTNERNRRGSMDEVWQRNPLQIANAIFVDDSHTLKSDFAQTFADYFRGTTMGINFNAPNAADAINQWASDNTNGRITHVIDNDDIDPDTAAAIVNAIYFSDQWAYQFRPEDTHRDIFHAPTGDVCTYFMRREWHSIMYFEDAQMQSLTLPFITGGGMTILLPHDGDAVSLLANMNNEKFAAIQTNSVLAEGSLLLPRFSVESTLDLNAPLSAMGLDALFSEAIAPITNLVPRRCFISDAIQVAMIEVDEEGATAAAVTVMMMSPESLPIIQTTFEMICNRPFAFILHRNTIDGGNQILFMGVVNQP